MTRLKPLAALLFTMLICGEVAFARLGQRLRRVRHEQNAV